MIKDSKELKVGDIFLNTNNHLSIVFGVSPDKAFILNYNTSIYSVRRDTQREYEIIRVISIKKFFYGYPRCNLNPDRLARFNYIEGILLNLNTGESDSLELSENKLLLIL